MQIVCPHCSTSYAVRPTALGPDGRQVRCARCREVWHALPDMPAIAAASASSSNERGGFGTSGPGHAAASPPPSEFDDGARGSDVGSMPDVPEMESPSISAEMEPEAHDSWADDMHNEATVETDPAAAEIDNAPLQHEPFLHRGLKKRLSGFADAIPKWLMISLPMANVAMAALCGGIIFWRTEIVRLMPQTAPLFRTIGLGVNLRGLDFTNLRLTSETVDGQQVLVIEGSIVDTARKTVEIPRLRFAIQDAGGRELYAWTAILDRPILKPGEQAWFRSRLASPPPGARGVTVRFFHRSDIVSGRV